MNVRETAFHSLLTICKDDGYSNIVVSRTIQKGDMNDRDRRFYTELVYGTVRCLNYLDWIIGKLSSRTINKLDPVCLVILRMGLYQIFRMSKIPESAACNEAVKMARRFGNRGMAGFVNALLRNSIRRRLEFQIPDLSENAPLHLSLTYHQPVWLVKKWIHDYGTDDTVRICQYFDSIPDLCLRTNTQRISRDELLQQLSKRGLQAVAASFSPEGIYLKDNPGIQSLQEIHDGLALIQDEPSQLVAHALDPQPHEVIFDVCAAPGGKTTHIAALAGPDTTVYGCDIYEHKLKLIESNARALHLTNVRTLLQDACTIGDKYREKADRVLVDAPCSGLGVLRRKLDLRWRKRAEDLQKLPVLQSRILESAAACVRPGGVLVYSTCTMNDGENSQVIQQFLQAHQEFKAENLGNLCGLSQPGPFIQLLPQNDELDGFFIARLRKEGHRD